MHRGPKWKQRAQDQTFVDSLVSRIRDSGHDGRLGVTVGENLPDILSGETDALEILFKDQLVEKIYRYRIGAEMGYEKMNACIDAFAPKKPDMKILDIGAGTGGGATLPVLDTLTHHSWRSKRLAGAPRFAHYDFIEYSCWFL